MILIGDVVEIISGYAFKSNLFNESGEGLPLVRIRDVGKKVSETYYSGEYSDVFLLKNGDFIIGMDGDFRLAKWEGGKALLNQRVCKITPNKEKIDASYLFYILPKELKKIEDVTSFATVKHLSAKDIKAISIPLPPLAEQQKIAAILDAADSLRHKDQQLVERYTALSQSLFLEMFGDPVTNPMGWARRKISDVCLKVTDGTHQSPRFISEGIPFLLVSNIVNNEINFKTKKFISVVDYDALTRNTPIEKNDILYTSVGSYGNPAIVKADIKFCFQRHIAHLKPNHQIINVKFLHAMLLSSYVKNQADKLARGVAQKTLNLKEIKSVEIYLPNHSDQNQFAERIQLIEAQKQQAQASLEKSEALFNSLLQRAFTGELTAKMAA